MYLLFLERAEENGRVDLKKMLLLHVQPRARALGPHFLGVM